MDEPDRLRLEYDRTAELLRGLAETRFKLLALVPTLSGAAVGLLRPGAGGLTLVAVGLLGLAATSGVLLYELRNGQIDRALAVRARELEGLLLGSRAPLVPPAETRLFGVVRLSRSRAIALVYGAALAGWSYVLAWGALRELGLDQARGAGIVLGAAAGIAVALEVTRIEGTAERAPAAPAAAPR